MTPHLDDEVLAQWAMGEGGPDGPGTAHLESCDRCATTLSELRVMLDKVHDLPELEAPPAELWARITDELSLDPDQPEDAPAAPVAQLRDKRRTAVPGRFRGRTLAVAATVAALVGAGVGIGGTLLLRDDEKAPPVEVAIKLDPLEGKAGAGTADLVRAAAGGQLKVTASGLSAQQGFYEVWLINTDGKRMVSLGVLDPATGGTFQIPRQITAQGYRIVDVSLEPDDGNPEHSHDSIIRGTLPA
ncbi:anti-sigma factor [Kribbella sp. NPDC051587]|uniref:anti-sigma factor n=1 Tax=Kribbella sp. NPDC051587 TaxID=3364119 RepID=UPI00378E5884